MDVDSLSQGLSLFQEGKSSGNLKTNDSNKVFLLCLLHRRIRRSMSNSSCRGLTSSLHITDYKSLISKTVFKCFS